MKEGGEPTGAMEFAQRRRTLWVLGGVCVILVAAYAVTGTVELRRMERLLTGMLTDRALTLVQGVEALAADRYDRFADPESGTLVATASLSLEESVVQGLVAAARRLAETIGTGDADAENLRRFAAAEHVTAGLLIGRKERATLPAGIWDGIRPILDGRAEITLDLFGSVEDGSWDRFVAVRAPGGEGAAVLLLGADDLRHWVLRAAVQAAVAEVGWREGVLYLEVIDGDGRTLALGGTPVLPPAFAGAPPAVRRHGPEGHTIWEFSVPFHLHADRIATARVGLAAEGVDRLLGQSRRHTLVTSGVLLAAGILCVAVLYRVQDRHHRSLETLRARLHRVQRLAALGRLGAGLAHEIRNPLNAIGLAAQRLGREHLPPEGAARKEFQSLTGILRSEVRRLDSLVEGFLRAAPDGRLNLRWEPLEPLVQEVAALFEPEARSRGVQITAEVAGGPCEALLDRDRMKQALVNLLKNALEAIPSEGTVTLRVEPLGPDRVRIRVTDTGVGIPDEVRPRIFDPDFTTKTKGLGLGLAISHEIVLAHGGAIEVESQPGRGSSFDVVLPREGAG